MEPLPSRSALVRIGKALAAGTETGVQLDQLGVLLARAEAFQTWAGDRLTEALEEVTLDSGGRLSVRGRTKTLITLRERSRRSSSGWAATSCRSSATWPVCASSAT